MRCAARWGTASPSRPSGHDSAAAPPPRSPGRRQPTGWSSCDQSIRTSNGSLHTTLPAARPTNRQRAVPPTTPNANTCPRSIATASSLQQRARHRSARTLGARRAQPRGRPKAPDVCASLRQSPASDHNLTPPCPSTARRQTAHAANSDRTARTPPTGADRRPPATSPRRTGSPKKSSRSWWPALDIHPSAQRRPGHRMD